MTRTFLLASALLVPFAATTARANTQCHQAVIARAATNWSTSITIPKHDPNVGALTAVTIQLIGSADGSVSLESLDGLPTVVTTTYQAVIAVQRPDTSVLLSVAPTAGFVDSLATYDGVLDFGGSSGTQHLNISLTQTQTLVITPPAADLALFIGGGTLTLPVAGFANSSASGPGNIVSQFITRAGAQIMVCYDYAPDCNHNGVPDATDIANGTSADADGDGQPDECQVTGTEGCSHGYWKNHLGAWGPTGYTPSMSFNTVFGVTAFTPDRTLLQALQAGGGGINNLGRQGTAALLDAAHPGVDFPLTPAQVIAMVQNAVALGTVSQTARYLDELVNLGCPLN